jgi:hypothetical protein
MTNYNNSVLLHVNSKGPFTIHYAVWPFVGLISLIVTVWLLVYISTALSRRHNLKNENNNFISQDSTIAGAYEASTVILPTDV